LLSVGRGVLVGESCLGGFFVWVGLGPPRGSAVFVGSSRVGVGVLVGSSGVAVALGAEGGPLVAVGPGIFDPEATPVTVGTG
jgi:hypothetical protein